MESDRISFSSNDFLSTFMAFAEANEIFRSHQLMRQSTAVTLEDIQGQL